jgi:HK97 family phage prohead protease
MKHNLKFKDFKIDSFKEETGGLTIEGYGAVFGNVDSYGDVIEPGAFAKTLTERKDRIAFCYQHDIWNPIGKILAISEDSKGLPLSVRLSDAEKDIQTKVREGILKEMSIGYRNINAREEIVEGRTVNHLTEIMLYEISLVTIAANPMALITGMKSEGQSDSDFINEEIERMIAIERNPQKKYDLMKLKSYIEALIKEEPKEITPTDEPLTKDYFLNLLFN